MNQKLKDFFNKNFGNSVPVKVRFLNTACIGAGFFSLLATINNLITGATWPGILACVVCTIGGFISYPASKLFKNHTDAFISLFLAALNFIIFPILYFTVGGIDSGMQLYFIVGVVFTILLIEKKSVATIMTILELAFFAAIMQLDRLHPEISDFFYVMGDDVYTDTALDLIVVSLCIGSLVKILAVNFEKQQKKTDQLLAQMEDLAVKDPLTGAYNRRFLIKYLESGIQTAKEGKNNIAIVMFDIDKFKRVNDDYGHLVGDEVIKALSSTLMKSCRDYDIVSRYGGEEFVLVLPGATENIAIQRAENIRQTFMNLKISDAIERKVTISGGVAELRANIKKPEDFINMADTNLYVAKETGRNKIVGSKYNQVAGIEMPEEK